MKITKATPGTFERLTEIWESAVRATHHFLPEEKIVFYRSQIPKYLGGVSELLMAVTVNGEILGFIGTTPPAEKKYAQVEMLFVDAVIHGQGVGKALLRHVADRYGPLEVDVNEQNPGALAFYEKCGFHVAGRSDTDMLGDPFPILHLASEYLTPSAEPS